MRYARVIIIALAAFVTVLLVRNVIHRDAVVTDGISVPAPDNFRKVPPSDSCRNLTPYLPEPTQDSTTLML